MNGNFSTVQNAVLDKVPPQNVEAEAAVLGSMLLEESAIGIAIELLSEGSFYNDAHRKIFATISKMYNANQAVDIVTLSECLRQGSILENVGGAMYLTHLVNSIPTAANAAHHAKIIKEKAILRNLISAATQIVSESFESHADAASMLDKAERLIFDIASSKIKGGFVNIKEIIKNSIEAIESLYQKKTYVTGVPTGFYDLDVMTAGLQPSDFIVVAGRPSMGKSALVANIIEHVAVVEHMPVAVFSIEMSREQLVQRILCSHARVNMQNVRTGYLAEREWGNLVNSASKLSMAPIFIDDTPAINVLELKAKARRLKSQHDIKLVVLDYMQLMQAAVFVQSRQQEIADISRSLKSLAKELNVPMVAVSQLSRAPERRENFRPRLSDLRESGAIEQDADVVMLLFREEYYNPTPENKGIAEVIIAKQRNGPVGTKNMSFLKEFSRFESISTREKT
ncbi:MAG: replicative DNA helicase [Candidatus Omnitrophota bacterium]